MKLIDTHSHLYATEFDNDRHAAVSRAIEAGVNTILLPNIDISSFESMMQLAADFPAHCFPMIGVHPTSINENFEAELSFVEEKLKTHHFCAVGEIGLDLYWDKTFFDQQKVALKRQIELARQYCLPVVIHQRNSFEEIKCLFEEIGFTGTLDEAKYIISKGFMLGLGGVLTYKKSELPSVIKELGLESVILETDSPYLAPVPQRGKRNESAFVFHVANKISDILEISVHEVARITTENAVRLFGLVGVL
jgi:TatD DNase family protein